MEEMSHECNPERIMINLPNIVGRFANRLGKFRKPLEEGIHPSQIPDIIEDSIGESMGNGGNQFNCYPGIPGGRCCSVAFFTSLSNPDYKRGRGHLTCRKALEKIVQHMQGSCPEKTILAVMITDSWDPEAFEDWKDNLHEISGQQYVRIFTIIGGTVSQIDISR